MVHEDGLGSASLKHVATCTVLMHQFVGPTGRNPVLMLVHETILQSCLIDRRAPQAMKPGCTQFNLPTLSYLHSSILSQLWRAGTHGFQCWACRQQLSTKVTSNDETYSTEDSKRVNIRCLFYRLESRQSSGANKQLAAEQHSVGL